MKIINSLLMLLCVMCLCACGGPGIDESKFTGKGILGDYPKAYAMQQALLFSTEAKQGDIHNFGDFGEELTPIEEKLGENISDDLKKSLKETETLLNEKKGANIDFKSKWGPSLDVVKATIDSKYASMGYVEFYFSTGVDSYDMFGVPLYKGKKLPSGFQVKFLDAQGNVIKETSADRVGAMTRSPTNSYVFSLGDKSGLGRRASFSNDETPICGSKEVLERNIDYLSKLDKIVKIEVSDFDDRPVWER